MSDTHFLFDFDGTLADSFMEALAAYNRVAPRLHLKTARLEELPNLHSMAMGPLMSALGISMWKLPKLMLAVRLEMREHVSAISPFPGIVDSIRELHRTGARLAILSSNSQENVERFLGQHQLSMFEQIDAGVSLFGKGTRLRRLLKTMKANKAQAVYIGDTLPDLRAAREAEIQAVAVTWGFSHRSLLEAEHPDALVDRPEDLPRVLVDLTTRNR